MCIYRGVGPHSRLYGEEGGKHAPCSALAWPDRVCGSTQLTALIRWQVDSLYSVVSHQRGGGDDDDDDEEEEEAKDGQQQQAR